MNKTPTQTKPALTSKMAEGVVEFPPHTEDGRRNQADLKAEYIREAKALSTVPLPGTLKGFLSTGSQALYGNNPAVLIDKLGERLAYERSGTRLYEAMLIKCRASHPELDTSVIEQIRDEEQAHFLLLRDTLVKLGADPTAQTPCANVSGMASLGLMQVMNDPRTNIAQCVEVLLMAELIDVAAWELLIRLASEAELKEEVTRFEQAKASEDKHLLLVKEWLERLISENKTVAPDSGVMRMN